LMDHASHMRRPTIQNIAGAYAAVLTFLAPFIFTIIAERVPGVQNDGADALSYLLQFPT